MALLRIENIRIDALAAATPANRVSNFDLDILPEKERALLVKTTGIEYRRVAPAGMTASDLCYAAADEMFFDLENHGTNVYRDEIQALIFVSQTPDHLIPGSASALSHQLCLSPAAMALDINQGCAGYVYGLATLAALMSAGKLKSGLLLVGDTITNLLSPEDKSTRPIFSDAGSATYLTLDETAPPMYFNLQSDGNGHKSIIVPEGGSRKPFTKAGKEMTEFAPGVRRSARHMAMEGLDIFHFASREVGPNVSQLLDFAETKADAVDHFVFHQANRLLNETIRKKLRIPAEKVPYSLQNYGNTSCATIPVTLVDQLSDSLQNQQQKIVLSGFGVGLSWASALIEVGNISCPKMIDL
jgi:3-oxoacyl-[acyl-carrier-protein] synthase-3